MRQTSSLEFSSNKLSMVRHIVTINCIRDIDSQFNAHEYDRRRL